VIFASRCGAQIKNNKQRRREAIKEENKIKTKGKERQAE